MYILSIFKEIIVNVNSSLYITSDRNDVTAADNPINNDAYEYIEGATSNQTQKGMNYNIHMHIKLCKTCG